MNSLKDQLETIGSDEEDDEAPIPGTVFNRRQARILKYVVIFLGLLLIAGFALLIAIIAHRASQPAKPDAPMAPSGVSVPQTGVQPPETALALPPSPTGPAQGTRVAKAMETLIPKGARYQGSTISGNRLIVTLQTPSGDLQLLLVDLARWQIIGTADLRQER